MTSPFEQRRIDERVRDERAQEFVDELNITLLSALPLDAAPIVGLSHRNYFVASGPMSGIPLRVNGEAALRLHITVKCINSTSNKFLAVLSSNLQLSHIQESEPILRYDFLRDPRSKNIPGAHINFHAESPGLTRAIASSGQKARMHGSRWGEERGGKPPQLHLPVGGHRFRPCLEDVIEMVIHEFGVEANPGWADVLASGRASWRTLQLRAAVHDNPRVAASTLRAMGYSVEWCGVDVEPIGHHGRLSAL